MYPTRVAPRNSVAGVDAGEELRAAERRSIERVLAGEPAAFRLLVDRYHRGVHAVIYRLVHNAADADDLAQQTFLSAYGALGSFKLDLKFSSWLYRIALNLAKDHLKSPRRRETASAETAEPEAGAALCHGEVPAPDSTVIASERERLLLCALAQLPSADREVLVLKDLEELSYEEMKAILGRPVTALKIRVVRARQKLRSVLERLAPQGAL